MSNELSIILGLLGCVGGIVGVGISVSNHYTHKKEKSLDVNMDLGYKQGQTDQLLKNIMEKLEKIDIKIDNFDSETKNIAREVCLEELKNHIIDFHK